MSGSHSKPVNIESAPLLPGRYRIEAGAGAGKTFALVGLVLRLVAEYRIRPDRIVLMTFTNAAADELRARLQEEAARAILAISAGGAPHPFLASRLASSADSRGEVAARLHPLAWSGAAVRVRTLHGLCQDILSEHLYCFDRAADFEIEVDRDGVIWAGVDQFIERHGLPDATGLSVDQQRDLLYRITGLRQTFPCARLHPEPAPEDHDLRAALTALAEAWRVERGAIAACIREGRTLQKRTNAFKPSYFEEEVVPVWDLALLRPGGPTLPARDPVARFVPEYLAARMLKGAGALPDWRFSRAADRYVRALDAQPSLLACRYLDWLENEHRPLRRAASRATFDELVSDVREVLLQPETPLARLLGDRFDAILVDEDQDTDPVQRDVVDRIAASMEEGYLFTVGDPKQSIYSFRGADLDRFIEAGRTFDAHFRLEYNWRSRPALVEALNYLYGNHQAAFGDSRFRYVPQRPARESIPAFSAEPPPVCVRLLESDSGRHPGKPDMERVAAIETALLCRNLSTRFPGQTIAVLVPKNEQVHLIRRYLKREGIEAESGQTRRAEGGPRPWLISLLRGLAESPDEAILRGHCLHLAHLAEVSVVPGDSPCGRVSLQALASSARMRWSADGPSAAVDPLLQAFAALIRKSGLTATGGQALDGLLAEIRNLLNSLDQAWFRRPLSMAEAFARLGGDDSSAPAEPPRARPGVVMVCTIHSAKGLEFGRVVLPLSWTPPLPPKAPFAVNHEGEDIISTASPAHASPELSGRLQQTRANERARLLYVAMTRAKEGLSVFLADTPQAVQSPLGQLLHNGAVTPSVTASSREAIDRLAAERPDLFTTELPSLGPGTVALPEARTPDRPDPASSNAAATFPAITAAPVAPGRLSFSRLKRDLEPEEPATLLGAVPDSLPGPEAAPKQDSAPGFDQLPPGISTGLFLHDLLERVDFSEIDPDVFEPLAREFLARRLPGTPLDLPSLLGIVRVIAGYPLNGYNRERFNLASVPTGDQLREAAFTFHASALDSSAIGPIIEADLAAAGLTPAPSRMGPVTASAQAHESYLSGVIDLLFSYSGRYYILDWKSNFLGADADAYGAERVGVAMADANYFLQLYLYTLATHRFLRARLKEYSYESHFGSAYYFFLRGLSHPQPAAPVFEHRPSAEAVLAMDELFSTLREAR